MMRVMMKLKPETAYFIDISGWQERVFSTSSKYRSHVIEMSITRIVKPLAGI